MSYSFALPSEIWNYGWTPNKLIDYMISERPIIAAYDGYRSMINEAECGFLLKQDAQIQY